MRYTCPTILLALAALTPGCADDECELIASPPLELCALDTAAPNAAITIQVSACDGCQIQTDDCSVAVDGDAITLSLNGTRCPTSSGEVCAAACVEKVVDCVVPALDPGTYAVQVGTDGPEATMRVEAGATATECRL